MDEPWADKYFVVTYLCGELGTKEFPNNVEATEYLEELADSEIDFDPYIHAVVIKADANTSGVLNVETHRVTRVSIGGC